MAATMSVANSVKGQYQKLLHVVRFMPGWLQYRPASTEIEAVHAEPEFDEEEVERKLAKIRDCSGLNKVQKLKHHGKMPEEIFLEKYRGDKRRKLRKMYAEHGTASGINPGIMYPSRAELADLVDLEKNWTQSFQQMKKNLEDKRAGEALAARLRDEKINKAMANMANLVKQYHDKQRRGEEEERRRDKTAGLLEEFRETYGYTVQADSSRFRAFKSLKSEEQRAIKAKQKKDEKKEKSMKGLQKILEEKISTKD